MIGVVGVGRDLVIHVLGADQVAIGIVSEQDGATDRIEDIGDPAAGVVREIVCTPGGVGYQVRSEPVKPNNVLFPYSSSISESRPEASK